MKNIDIIKNVNKLNEFVDKDKVVPMELSFAISANISEMMHKLEPYEVERKKLLKKPEEEQDEPLQQLLDIDVNVDEI